MTSSQETRGNPPAMQQVMSPRRLAERMAAAGAQAAQPAAAPQANPRGFYQGVPDPPPVDPALSSSESEWNSSKVKRSSGPKGSW